MLLKTQHACGYHDGQDLARQVLHQSQDGCLPPPHTQGDGEPLVKEVPTPHPPRGVLLRQATGPTLQAHLRDRPALSNWHLSFNCSTVRVSAVLPQDLPLCCPQRLLQCSAAEKPLGATGFQMAGWWSWRGAWVHLYGPVLYDNATGLGSYLPSVVSAAPESRQNQSASLLFYPSERSGRMCGRLLAPTPHDRPFLVMDHLTPSSVPPAFPSWRALCLVMADPSCRGPWNFCLHGLLLRAGSLPC